MDDRLLLSLGLVHLLGEGDALLKQYTDSESEAAALCPVSLLTLVSSLTRYELYKRSWKFNLYVSML